MDSGVYSVCVYSLSVLCMPFKLRYHTVRPEETNVDGLSDHVTLSLSDSQTDGVDVTVVRRDTSLIFPA